MPNILQISLGVMSGVLARNIAALAPGELRRSFFCNSGAEAVEGALKLARVASGKTQIIYADNSFHGKSFGALSVTGRDKYQKPFGPLLPEVKQVPFGDAEALEATLRNRDVAAFIVEPIQGEGGIVLPPQGYLADVRRICTKYDTLLILDEIQTGLGRTGKMFACEHENISPDIMCLAKSLGGGIVPIGAFITTDAIWQKAYGGLEKCTLHTSTFGGNTRACAAGIAALGVVVEEKLNEAAAQKGDYILKKLVAIKEKHGAIKEARGKGLLIGMEFNELSGGILNKISIGAVNALSKDYFAALVSGDLANKHHIITAYTLNNPNVIRLEPPLNISYEDIDYVISSLDETLGRFKGILSAALGSAGTVISSFFGKR